MIDESNSTGKVTGRRAALRHVTEEKIFIAAETVFAQAGFGGATMQLIANLSGIAKPNLHYYFGSKELLYRAVLQRIFRMWLRAAEVMDDASTPAEGIGGYIDAKMEISRLNPNASKVWANEVMHGASMIQDCFKDAFFEWTSARISVIERWVAEGKMLPVNARYLLYLVWASTQHYADFGHQITILNHDTPLSDVEWETAKRSVKELVLRGIGAELNY
ncbi:MAG: TetR family transcriptional regulator C-terminal domain-containing protein [Paracoccaceae bacterium]|nr:TetR family transcriptional regulator C-terminal domain-containing protein [Paracoccaceae bacterium]